MATKWTNSIRICVSVQKQSPIVRPWTGAKRSVFMVSEKADTDAKSVAVTDVLPSNVTKTACMVMYGTIVIASCVNASVSLY